jgi:hypothetical protein
MKWLFTNKKERKLWIFVGIFSKFFQRKDWSLRINIMKLIFQSHNHNKISLGIWTMENDSLKGLLFGASLTIFGFFFVLNCFILHYMFQLHSHGERIDFDLILWLTTLNLIILLFTVIGSWISAIFPKYINFFSISFFQFPVLFMEYVKLWNGMQLWNQLR